MRSVGLFLLLLFTSSSYAGEGRNAFDRFIAGLTTLEARFEQTVVNAEIGDQSSTKGVFYLNRPGQFRWDYETPEIKSIIADGFTLWVLESDLQQASEYNQKFALKDTPATILLSSEPLENSFKITEAGNHSGLDWLELIPIDTEGNVERVLLAFNGDELRQLELQDKFGQFSRFNFFDIKRNPVLAKEKFQHDIDPDWDIIQY